MRTLRDVTDVFGCIVPEGVDPRTLGEQDLVAARLLPKLLQALNDQYDGLEERPEAVLLDRTDWFITNQADEVEAFQPAHDCPSCQASSDQARAFLREHPDRWIALANLWYREVWP